MKRLLFLLVLLPVSAAAQTDSLSIPKLVLKANIAALANPFKPALALGADIRLHPRWSADAGLGYFLGSPAFAQYDGESYTGPRLRAGLKYHYRITSSGVFHVGLETRYHDIAHTSIRNAMRQGGQYTEFLNTRRTLRTFGGAVRAGAQFFGSRNRRLLLEPYLGLGFARHRVAFSLPHDAELLDQGEFFDFEYPEGITWMPDVLFGVHLGFALGPR